MTMTLAQFKDWYQGLSHERQLFVQDMCHQAVGAAIYTGHNATVVEIVSTVADACVDAFAQADARRFSQDIDNFYEEE